MMKPGLVSITFRELTVEEIIEASVSAGIKGIEWGGDVHVPHGDLHRAEEVGEQTLKAGLEVAAYGSYYRFENDGFSFNDILNTAKALGAPLIRVWAGRAGSAESDSSHYNRIVSEAGKAGELCRKAGIDLAFEYHGNTLTDTNESARKFIEDINHPSVYSYWQPPVGMNTEECLQGIDLIQKYMKWVHVFHWGSESRIKFPLSEGIDKWKKYIRKINSENEDRWFLLEFVKDGTVKQFYEDAKILTTLLNEF